MKKIILACCLLALTIPAATAQKVRRPASTTTTISNQDGNSATIISPGHANTAEPGIQSKARATDASNLRASDIVVPDHAYEPAGTETVGFFGNGMGGSTMGSSPDGGGTGLRSTTTIGTEVNTPANTNRKAKSATR